MSALVKVAMYDLGPMLEERLDLIKKTVCKDATDNELLLFLHTCKRYGLDPFLKQIYSFPSKRGRITQTSIDGFRLIAERTGNYSPGREPTFADKEKGGILSATAYVLKRTSDGQWHEVSATAFFDEYRVASSDAWRDKPHVMISKCAEALALRKAFPANMSGIYTADELEGVEMKRKPEEDSTTTVEAVEILPFEELVNFSANIVDEINGTKDRTYCLPYGPFVDFLRAWQDKLEGKKSLKTEVSKWIKNKDTAVSGFTKWRNRQQAKILEFKQD